MSPELSKELYKRLVKTGVDSKYDEEIHCPMLLQIMDDPRTGRYSSFCVKAEIGESTFYDWLNNYPNFKLCYSYGKMLQQERWEEEGEELKSLISDEIGCKFEHWRMVGWMRYGLGKVSRIRLDLDPNSPATKQYSQLIKQAKDGAFTAGEIKQLMEALAVGLKVHELEAMQKDIDELKAVQAELKGVSNGANSFATKGS